MSTAAPTNSAIVTDYKARTQGSGALFERARKVLPSGITHDARYLDPYSIHVATPTGTAGWWPLWYFHIYGCSASLYLAKAPCDWLLHQ